MAFDFPSPATSGQTVTGPNGAVWMFDGVKWLASGITQSAVVIESDTPPANPPVGTLWWDSFGGNLYIWYQDPNTSQWVIANEGGIADAPTDGQVYARQSQSWTNISAVSAAAPNNTGRNLLHNGQFNIAQRGAGGFTAQGYTLDRWYLYVASDTVNVSQNALADVQRTQIGDEVATVSVVNTFTGNAAAGAYSFLTQNIEGVRRLAGKTITVSFWAWCGSGALKLGVSFDQNFGTGGSPSAAIAGTGQSVTLSTTATRYSLTFSIASAAGKTLGTAGNDLTALNFWFSSGTTQAYRNNSIGVQSGAIGIWGVQLEIGSVATPLAKRDPADELALCQRFYQTGGNGALSLQGYTQSGVGVGVTGLWPVQFRAVPTLTINWSNAGSVTSPSFTATTSSWFIGGSGSGSGGFILNSSGFTASADL